MTEIPVEAQQGFWVSMLGHFGCQPGELDTRIDPEGVAHANVTVTANGYVQRVAVEVKFGDDK